MTITEQCILQYFPLVIFKNNKLQLPATNVNISNINSLNKKW